MCELEEGYDKAFAVSLEGLATNATKQRAGDASCSICMIGPQCRRHYWSSCSSPPSKPEQTKISGSTAVTHQTAKHQEEGGNSSDSTQKEETPIFFSFPNSPRCSSTENEHTVGSSSMQGANSKIFNVIGSHFDTMEILYFYRSLRVICSFREKKQGSEKNKDAYGLGGLHKQQKRKGKGNGKAVRESIDGL